MVKKGKHAGDRTAVSKFHMNRSGRFLLDIQPKF